MRAPRTHAAIFAMTILSAVLSTPTAARASGRLVVDAGAGERALEVVYLHVGVVIDERLARTTVTQVFANHTDRDIEGVYEFPLPRDAAVAGFAVWDAGERLDGEIEEKEVAREGYDEAVEEGGRPALVAERDERGFRMDIFGIPAGGTKRVELVYTELLDYSAGVVSYVFPARYREKTAEHIGWFDVDIDLNAPAEIAFVGSPTWPEMNVTHRDDTSAHLSLSLADLEPTRDVDVVFGVETTPFGFTSRFHRPVEDEPGYFALGFAFNRDDAPERRPPRDIVLAVDSSLSMAGGPLERARQLAADLLSELPASDSLNVVSFDTELHRLAANGRRLDEAWRGKAASYVEGLRARGGSDLGTLVAALPNLFDRSRGEPFLVLITDGHPTVGERDGERLAAALAAGRVKPDTVVVQTGYPSRRRLLEHMAPGALYQYVPPGASGDAAAEEVIVAVTAPAMRNVVVRVDGMSTHAVHPAGPATLLAGRQLLVTGRYLPPPLGLPVRVSVAGELHGEQRHFEYFVRPPGTTDDRQAGLAREWAKAEVRDLLRAIDRTGDDAEREKLIATVVELGKTHRLVTPYTSFLVRRPAHLSLERFKPGDPEIYIEAPPDLLRVVAVLPWGEAIPCRYLPEQERWMGRFLVPRGTPDGLYLIRVILVAQSGEREAINVFYRVDSAAPRMSLELPDVVSPGEHLVIRALPVEHVFEGSGRAVRLRTDVRRAVAHVTGRTVPLKAADGGSSWEGSLALPRDLPPGDYELRLVVTDWAANSFETTRTLHVAAATEETGP